MPKTPARLAPAAVFPRIQAHCLAKPRAVEEYPWGDIVWKVDGKMFAATGHDNPHVTVKATPEDQAVLIQHPAISIAKYVGRFGWVTIEICDTPTLELAFKLIDDSYAALAGDGKARPAPGSKPQRKPRPQPHSPPQDPTARTESHKGTPHGR